MTDFQKTLVKYYIQGVLGEELDEDDIEFIALGEGIAYYSYNSVTYVVVDAEQGPIAHEANEEQEAYIRQLEQ